MPTSHKVGQPLIFARLKLAVLLWAIWQLSLEACRVSSFHFLPIGVSAPALYWEPISPRAGAIVLVPSRASRVAGQCEASR